MCVPSLIYQGILRGILGTQHNVMASKEWIACEPMAAGEREWFESGPVSYNGVIHHPEYHGPLGTTRKAEKLGFKTIKHPTPEFSSYVNIQLWQFEWTVGSPHCGNTFTFRPEAIWLGAEGFGHPLYVSPSGNGRGYQPQHIARTKHVQIVNIDGRARVRVTNNGGTSVTFAVPRKSMETLSRDVYRVSDLPEWPNLL
jgi:hypothetical protein